MLMRKMTERVKRMRATVKIPNWRKGWILIVQQL
jgi:hypothetical protein